MGIGGRVLDMIGAVKNLRLTTSPRENTKDRHHRPSRSQTAGIYMSADEAMRLSAVWACVTVIAKAIASCDWDVFVESPNGDRTSMKSSTTWKLLNLRPNSEMIPFAFREAMLIVALVWGDAFAEIEFDLVGRPVAIWPLMPDRCCLSRNSVTWKLELHVRNGDGSDTILPYEDVFHLHGPSLDGVAGFDVVALGARSMALAAAAERFGVAFYNNNASPGGVLASDNKLSPEQKSDLREILKDRHAGREAWTWMVTDGGLKPTVVQVNQEQAQHIEGRQFQVVEICRWFGVPPHKIAHLVNATFSNIEHQSIEFVRDALTPWCERLRQEADFKLIPGVGRFLRTRIDTDWLAEGDAKSRADTDSVLVTAGIMTRNQARRKRGWNSLGPDGDVPTVNPGTTALPVALEPPKPSPKQSLPEAMPGQGDNPPADAPAKD